MHIRTHTTTQHTHAHTHIHTCAHTHTHTHTHICMYIHTNMCTHTYTCTYTHMHINVHLPQHTHTHINMYTYRNTHTYVHTLTNTQTPPTPDTPPTPSAQEIITFAADHFSPSWSCRRCWADTVAGEAGNPLARQTPGRRRWQGSLGFITAYQSFILKDSVTQNLACRTTGNPPPPHTHTKTTAETSTRYGQTTARKEWEVSNVSSLQLIGQYMHLQ